MSAKEALDRMVRLVRDTVVDGVTDDEIVGCFQRTRVRCVADEANVASVAGQSALVTLVSLIARMGVQVAIDVPDVDVLGSQPPLRGARLRSALIDLGDDLVPGTSVRFDRDVTPDLTFALGDSPAPPKACGWRLTGTAWAGAINSLSSPGQRWDGAWSVGAMTAGAIAAPEVFKAVATSLPLRHSIWAETLAPCPSAAWAFAVNGLSIPSGPLSVDIISAGAIAQAALFVLLRLPIQLAGRLFDGDVAELSNVNRQVLYRRSDLGFKVDIMKRFAEPFYSCTPIRERFTASAFTRVEPLAPFVLVGVDDIPARWDAQRATQGWLGVGGTSHFSASISSHEPGTPCAGCLHPRDERGADGPIPTVSFVSFWAGLALAVRFLRAIGGSPYPSRHQHLWLSPLRLDQAHAALWQPVAPRKGCPASCRASEATA